ncbi:MAG TPA: ferrous iron transporter B [Bdellovibrionales bacterium]|nr:ferrous iron transporter B [Bdellovibrionales bacterium]
MRDSVTAAASATPALDHGFVALVGSPNSGKTTLFNWLTGSRFKTVNYPGATVDYSLGKIHDRYEGGAFTVMDTPGTYSLDPKSPDERVTFEAIFNHKTHGAARLVIAVADATHLARQLLLTRQLLESGFDVVLAVTMSDMLAHQGDIIDVPALEKALGIRVVLIDGRLGGGVADLVSVVRQKLVTEAPRNATRKTAWSHDKLETSFKENVVLAESVLTRPKVKLKTSAAERTRAMDRVLLHPLFGLAIFFVLMATIFSSVFWFAAPAMDFVDGTLSGWAEAILARDPHSLIYQFLANGVIASINAVIVFVPQIFILFIGIIFLEDSGYLARSATLMDRPLSKLGLGGRSFVSLLSGYACAIPAMMAARTINSRKERWLTLFVVPLMSCSARLPVYALLLSFLFHDSPAWYAGVALAGLYFGSMIVGAIAALIASKLIKFEDRSFFMLELPVYRMPRPKLVLRQALTRTMGYVKRAGPPIFVFALIVWLGTTFPNYDEDDATVRLNTSYAAQVGQVIEPVFEPMGGDWRTGVGLISAFAAREVFVSSLAVVFQVADDNEDTMQETLLAKMSEAKAPDGQPLFTIATVLGLAVFFMIALQCLTTFVVAQRESGGWKFAVMQLVVFNAVAYGLAVAIVQGLRAVGIA